ncbi:hypothetical protein SAMN02799624_04936 [Paenibacillus sp. UNC496MF]|uniref:hypothetical protein n=1 Tax=Paenibacillus sp. UNC496MF TaxID=1502753 RepID=UPI0008E51907|nr:hypothetical protein [Paenibacillus sp. UNC496MF]SFJ54512.1 hypothetical protein SAMN02799624_04936 [Paenibacillus sp. UNC496MF]
MSLARKMMLTLGIAAMVLALAACSGNNAVNSGNDEAPVVTGTDQPTNDTADLASGSKEPSAEQPLPPQEAGDPVLPPIAGGKETGSGTVTDRLPAEKTFELELEGMQEEKTAMLAEGNGYSLYVYDIFNYDAANGKLMMDFDENYNVEIEKLPADYNLDELKTEAEAELSELGEVSELQDSEIHPMMQDARLVLKAGASDLTKQYIVKDIGGSAYAFKVNKPQGEASDGFETHAYLMLNSIVTR